MNRKQRRAQQSSTQAAPLQSADQIPLRVPDRGSSKTDKSTPKAKTLYEIAAEKQAELVPQIDGSGSGSGSAGIIPAQANGNLVSVKVNADGTIVHDNETNEPFRVEELNDQERSGGDAELPPVIDTLMLVVSLGAIHFTLEFLTMHQYAEEVQVMKISRHTFFVAMPTLFLMVYLFHGHLFAVPFLDRRAKYFLLQLFFVGVANVAGCYLIQLTNDRGYYAVMKNAPSIGTVWVWSVIELGLVGALAGVVGPGVYAWFYGYTLF